MVQKSWAFAGTGAEGLGAISKEAAKNGQKTAGLSGEMLGEMQDPEAKLSFLPQPLVIQGPEGSGSQRFI